MKNELRLAASILEHFVGLPEGATVSARELLHLGSRAALDQSLSRLAQSGQLLRAGRGLYVRPIETRFGPRPPALESVIQALGHAKGEVIASHGARAANLLGLTLQVPVRAIYLTSGPTREFQLGGQTVELRHAPAWQLTLAGRPAGEALRALAWLGEEGAGEALRTLRQRLPAGTLEELASARARLPTWLAKEVSRLVVDG